ncbi:putative Ig domain-containing protein [Brevundimonas sp.]|uniref:putative Ig domain-containing protein n=1 Tax=Brevundimonas sp. TaxID=1871086 RepID=UPI002FCA755D
MRSLLRAHGVWVALFIAMLSIMSPGTARAQATCAIDFSVNYNASNFAHVMSMTSNFDEFAACDPRYVANPGDPASGFTPYVQTGSTANGGSFTTQVNAADDTIRYTAPTGFSGADTFIVYFCNDINCSGAGARVATVTVTVGTPTIVVNPASLPAATVAAAYSQTLTGAGGQAPYGGFTVISGALPAGLSLAAGGALTGTPTASGVFNFTIRTTDSSTGAGPFQGSRPYTLTVNAPSVTVNPTTLPAAAVGSAYSQTMTGAGGTAPYGSFTVIAGALPAGLSLNSSSGALTGTPTAGGSFNFTIRTTDSTTGTGPHTGSRPYTLTVNTPTITVSPTSLTAGTQGAAYSQTISASGGTSSYGFAVTSGALPAGLTLAAGGGLTGTPTVNGSFNFTVTATDSSTGTGPYTGARPYTLVINPPPAPVANAVSATVAYNSTGNPITLNITGGAAVSVATPGLPSHGTVNVVGTTITYTPTTNYGGPDSFTYTATNAGGTSAAATVTITVSPPTITVSPTTLPNGTTGVAYSQAITAAGGSGTYTYAVTSGAQPAGLTLSAAGVLSGTPSGTGPYTFTVTATDTSTGNGPYTGAQAYTVTIITPDPAIANPVSATVAYNSVNNPITLNITGGAPTSVAVSTAATNGTAAAAGTSITYTPTPGYFGSDSFAYTATNADGTSAPATVTITVNPQPPVANAVAATVAQDSSNNPITLNITGGAPVSVNGSAAVNGSINVAGTSITFTPTPGYNGPASFSYTATNAGGTSAPATVSITVNPFPPVANAASVTVAYNSSNNPVTLNITGGTPTSVATPGLPSNGTVSVAGTSITYTPTPGYFGSDSFTYTATNGGGTSAPATVTVTVNPQPPVANAVSATVGQDTSNNPITLNITGGAPASVNGSAAVNGSINVAGTSITFTPTPGYNGPASFSYTATNAGGTSAPATASITVTPLPPIASAVSVTVGFESTNNPVTLSITGGTPASVAAPGLPTNGSVNVAGTAITYTPNAGYAGPDSFTYTATNTGGTSAPATVTVTVNPPPAPIAGAVSVTVAANSSNNAVTLSLTGGTATSVATPGLPTHGTVSIAGTAITYTPTAGYSGADSFTYTATNLGGTSAPATVTVTVSAPTLTLSALTTTGQVTAAYSDTVVASLGTAPYTYSVTAGALPPGLGLTTAGVLSGTATASGTFNFTVTASDVYGATGARAYAIVISPPTVVITSPGAGALPAVEAYGAYSETLTATGGVGPNTLAVTAGALPPGISLSSSGVLSGTPTTPGVYNFTVTPSDSSASPGPYSGPGVAYSITVTAPVIALSPGAGALTARTTALGFTETFTATGGIGPYAFSLTAGGLPPGISLSSGGVFSGTPTSSGTYNFTITAEDSHGFTGANAYSVTVSDPTIAIASPAAGALPSVEAYGSYSQTFTATGGIGPHSFALSAGALPPGLALTNGGVLSGAPTTPGTFNFSLTASDSSGAPGPFVSAPVAYSITVTAPAIVLSPAAGALTSRTTALAFTETFTATGGVGPYSFSHTAGALPPGVSLSSGGVFSGAPTAAGTYNFTVTAEDSHGFTGSTNWSVTVADPVVTVTSPATGALPSVEAYGAYSQTFAATGGIGPRSFALAAGALPPGLGLTSGGVLSGAPTTPGTYNFSVTGSDSSGAPGPFVSAPVAYSITVTAPAIVLSPAAGALTPRTTALAASQTFTATGGVGPYSFSLTAGALPPGVSLSSGGVFSGAPTAAGTYNFTVTADDSHGFTGSTSWSVTVADPVVTVTSPATGALPSVEAYGVYSQTFTATGGIGPRTFALTAGALPPGISLSSGGSLSGTPTTPGTYNFSVTGSDSSGAPGPFVSAPVAYSITVTAPTISFTPAAGSLTPRTTALAFTQTFSATGGVSPYSFSLTAGALPPGVSLSGGGVFSGAPTAAGTYNFTVTAEDSHGFSAANAYSVTVSDPIVTLTTPSAGALPGGTAFTSYSQTFTATGGIGPRSFALATGALPPGMSLSSGGVLSGAPTAAGTFNFTLTAQDSSSAPGPFVSAPVAFSLTVAAPTVTIASPATGALSDATATVAYSQTFTATGGNGTHAFAVTAGALPPGVSLSGGGVLSGTPTTPGTYNFTLVASDTSGAPGPYSSLPVAYSLTVVAPTVTITSPAAGALPGVIAFGSVNQTFTATGGLGPRNFAVVSGALPAGVSLSGAGVLSGAPTTPGTYNFSVAASDSSGAPGPFISAAVAYSLVVSAPTISLAPATLPDGTTGQAYAQSLTASGGAAPYSYSLTAGALPAGIALAGGGSLSGAPTAAGTFGFTVTATDAHGFSAANTWSLVIIDAAPVAGADSATTPANQAVVIPVTANDTGIITSVAMAAGPTHGTAAVGGLTVTYTPAPNYFGPDSFTYTATGPGGTSAPAVVSVTVTPLAVPTAAAKAMTVLAGQTGSVDATAGSTGAPITAVSVADAPAHGSATVSGQSLVYTPAAGYAGADSFTYTLTNPFGTSVPATVMVTVNPAPITAAPITVEILAGQTASVNITAGASGGPFNGAALVSLTPSTAGTAAITNPVAGQYGLTFTPAADFAGTVTAAYTLSNAFATSATGTVTVIVTARPDPVTDPEVTGLISAQGETARRFATAQISNVNSRLESLRDGGGAGASLQLNFSGGSRDMALDNDPLRRRLGDDDNWSDVLPGLSYGDGLANEADSALAAGTDMSAASGRFGLWAAGGIDFGQRDATTGQQGVEFDTDGLTAGADLRVSDQFVLGASVGWGHDESRIGDDGTRSDSDGYSYAVYGSYQPGARFFIDGLLGYGTLNFDSRRYITASGDFAYGERDGSQWFGAVTGGWDIRDGRRLLSPYGRLTATQSDLGAYSETTGGVYALAYESQTARTLTGTFGLRSAWSFLTSFGEVVPRFRLEYSHDFQGSDRANLFYVDWVDGPVYGVDVDPMDQNRVLGGVGLDVLTLAGSRFSFEYEVSVGNGSEQHQVRLLIQSRF